MYIHNMWSDLKSLKVVCWCALHMRLHTRDVMCCAGVMMWTCGPTFTPLAKMSSMWRWCNMFYTQCRCHHCQRTAMQLGWHQIQSTWHLECNYRNTLHHQFVMVMYSTLWIGAYEFEGEGVVVGGRRLLSNICIYIHTCMCLRDLANRSWWAHT